MYLCRELSIYLSVKDTDRLYTLFARIRNIITIYIKLKVPSICIIFYGIVFIFSLCFELSGGDAFRRSYAAILLGCVHYRSFV